VQGLVPVLNAHKGQIIQFPLSIMAILQQASITQIGEGSKHRSVGTSF
jgi:hypothetical protein